MSEGLSVLLFLISLGFRGKWLGSMFSFVALIISIYHLRDASSSVLELLYATAVVFLFWFAQSIRFSFSSVRTLVVMTLGLGAALFLFQGIFPSFGSSAITGKWKGFDLSPGTIASLQTSHEKAIELYMDHSPTREERYFRVGSLSETTDGLNYHVGPRGVLKPANFPETSVWARARLKGKDLQTDIGKVESWWIQGFQYSLTPGQMEQAHPLDQFLFDKKVGFCEHYAAALSTLLKLAGYDARVAVGFSGGSWNPVSRKLTYEMADSHAWVEAYDRNQNRWSRVDPTLWVQVQESKLRSNYNEVCAGLGIFVLLLLFAFSRSRRRSAVDVLFERVQRLERKLELDSVGLTLKERITRLSHHWPEHRDILDAVLAHYQQIYFAKEFHKENLHAFQQTLRKLRWVKPVF